MANLPTSIKNLNNLLGEQLTEGGGGGGSSDFSTAKVNVSGSGRLYISCVNRYDDSGTASIIGESGIYDVILYKGVAYGFLDTESPVSITGFAEYDDGDLTITGDCTITISGGGDR